MDVLGVGISAVNPRTALAEVTGWMRMDRRNSAPRKRRTPKYVCFTGVHGVMECQDDPDLRAIHNSSAMTAPDGMPMVWACRWAGFKAIERVSGPDLMPLICAAGVAAGWRHYFYGGAAGVADLLAEALSDRFPGMRVVGTHTPPFRPLTDREKDRVTAAINDARPDCVWVGLSTPKQERWMADMAPRLDVAALFGVGAAFDFLTGRRRRAPVWMQRTGLEWLHRSAADPLRLAPRYFRNNPRFVAHVLRRPPRRMG